MNTPLIAIVGPTASGKTAFAIEIAKRINGEIVCADSRTVYKDMDIGSAKPTTQERKEVRHHLLDIVEPDEQFSAAQFKELAQQAIREIEKRGRLPIMVGGTGLYVDAILFDYQFGSKADDQKRAELSLKTTEELIQECSEKNIEIPTNFKNRRHLIRALELGGLQKVKPKKLRPNTLVLGIDLPPEELCNRITKRIEYMVSSGIIEETWELGKKYGWEHESLTGSAYRIFRGVLEGNLSEQEAVEACIRSDLQLAKRQKMWFKRSRSIAWGKPEQLSLLIEHFLAHQNKNISH